MASAVSIKLSLATELNLENSFVKVRNPLQLLFSTLNSYFLANNYEGSSAFIC